MIECLSTSLNKHVNEWAKCLKDAILIAKLSEGDLPAIEAKYHKKCLTDTYNSFLRASKKMNLGERELLSSIEDLALSDVVEYIQDTIALSYDDNTVPVFTQKSLTDFYKSRIIHHGSLYDSIDSLAFSQTAHATRLQEKILEKVPGLCVAKRSREV